MTTTVTIKHNGPDHHDVMITEVNPLTGYIGYGHRLSIGKEITVSVYDSKGIGITEVPKLPKKLVETIKLPEVPHIPV